MKAALPKGSKPLVFSGWNTFTRLLKFGKANSARLRKIGFFDPTSGLKRKKNGELTKGSISRLAKRRKRINKAYDKLGTAEAKFGFGGQIKNMLYYQRRGSGARSSVDIGYRNDRQGKYANAFQSAESRPLSDSEKHFRHRIQGDNIEGTYRRPARPFIQPFADDPETARFIIDASRKNITARIEKARKKAAASAAQVKATVQSAVSRSAFARSFRA